MTRIPGAPARPAAGAGPSAGVVVDRTVLVAQSTTWLRHLLDHPVSLSRTRRIRIVVEQWRIPQRSWSGRLGPLPQLLAHRARMPKADRGTVLIDIEMRWSAPLRTIIAAVLPMLVPVRVVPTPVSADVTAQDILPGWLGTHRNTRAVAGALPGNDDVRPHDIVLTRTGEPQPPVEPDLPGAARAITAGADDRYGVVLAADADGSGTGARPRTAVVDIQYAVPRRRYGPFGPAAPRAELTFTGADGRGWRIDGPDGVRCGGRLDRPWLSERDHEALMEIGTLGVAAAPGRHPLEEVSLLLNLVLAGVLVHAPELPAASRDFLTEEVRGLLVAELPGGDGAELPGGDGAELAWEVRAVRQRRAVMRGHATQFALPRLTAGTFPAIPALPSVSALLVTKRLEHVMDAFTAIEAQTYPNLEIVLCLHGVDLPTDLRDRIARSPRPVELLTLPAGHGFGEAIGVATGRARGSLVTKFDDDDIYGPEHVWDLVLARHHSGAAMVGKGAEFVYLETLDTTVRRDAGTPESYTTVVAGGTMLIGRGDLEQVGGWRPVPRSIDRGLIDRVRQAGGLIYRTHPLGYVYHRRSAGHTWDPGLEYFLRGGPAQWSGLLAHPEFGAGVTTPAAAPATAGGAPVTAGGVSAVQDGAFAASGTQLATELDAIIADQFSPG